MNRSLSRRSFLRAGSAAAAAPLVIPGRWRTSPNETLNVACVGVGGMGGSDLASVSTGKNVRIAALCDVDAARLGAAAQKHEGAKTFADYRVLLDEMGKDIDAVVVSTPDHMHGPVSLAAMALGKHVYCQKPIAHNLRECRAMADMAKEKGLVTQMGTQIHGHSAYRTAVATLRAGAIGKVREAHLWVSKSWAGPAEGRPDRADPVPENLSWDLWLGVAPERPYVQGAYHPAQWRGWIDFGSGTLGDMGCHIFDPVFSGLGLAAPISVVSRGPKHHAEAFAGNGDVTYRFAATDQTDGELVFRWTDGGAQKAVEKAQLPEGASLPGAGSFLVGEKGVMVIPHWSAPRFYSEGKELQVEVQERGSVDHYHEWTDACRGEGETSTPFSYAGPLTDAVLAGVIAGRFPEQELAWDSAGLRFDHEEANACVGRTYREGREVVR